MRSVAWNRFSIRIFANVFNLTAFVETSHLNTDLYEFESSQSEENRAHPVGSSKA